MEDFAYAPISIHRVINRPTRDPCSRCGGAVSDSWSSKLVVNEECPQASRGNLVYFARVSANFRVWCIHSRLTWKIRYLYEARDEGKGKEGRKKKGEKESIFIGRVRIFFPFLQRLLNFLFLRFSPRWFAIEQWFDDTNPSSRIVFFATIDEKIFSK